MQEKNFTQRLSSPAGVFPMLFVRLLSVTILTYFLRIPRQEWFDIAVILLSWSVLILPARPLLLAAWSTVYLAFFWKSSPVYSNFLTCIGFCHLAILAGIVKGWFGKKEDGVEPRSQVLDSGGRLVRAVVLWMVSTTYFFSAFHKLNTAFLDPETSYAVKVCENMLTQEYPFLFSWLQDFASLLIEFPMLAIYGTLVVEFSIAILVFFPRLHPLAFALDLGMHFFFGLRLWPISTNYPLLMISAFATMCDDRKFSLPESLTKIGQQRVIRYSLFAIGGCFFIFGGFVSDWRSSDWFSNAYNQFRNGLYLVIFLVAAWIVARGVFQRVQAQERWFPVRMVGDLRPRMAVILPLLFLINGFAIYSGFKTRTAMEMYSGLSIRDGKNNHLIMPESLITFPYTSEWVTPIESDNYEIQKRIFHGFLLSKVEIRTFLSVDPDFWVVFEDQGERFDTRVSRPELATLNEAPTWWERKLVNLLHR